MKRVDYIKEIIINAINSCKDENFLELIYDFQKTDCLGKISTKVLSEFDDKYYFDKSDAELSQSIKSGQYNQQFQEWIEEYK